jgi:formylglycine-generating enzyme required for sulfatase activity
MNSQRARLTLVSLLLLCSTIVCGERPQAAEQERTRAKDETETVVSEPDGTEERASPVELTNSIGMKLRLIPAGEFMMGSAKSPEEISRLFEDVLPGLDTANVWEWCSDWYDRLYYKESPSTDPTGPATGFQRMFRGGSWIDRPMYCRSAYRNGYFRDARKKIIGFRVA